MILLYIVLATLAGGVLSVLTAALLTLKVLGRLVKHLVSLSAGVLLGTALLHVLPEAFESRAEPHSLFLTLLVGLLFFFLLEKAELYRHGHHHEGDGHGHHHHYDEQQAGRGGWAVLVGDSIHNFCDGVIIAAAFLADAWLGWLTAIGGVLGYLVVEPWRELFPYLLVVAASSFVYISVADLLPQLQRRLRLHETLAQLAWLAAGLLAVVLIGTARHH